MKKGELRIKGGVGFGECRLLGVRPLPKPLSSRRGALALCHYGLDSCHCGLDPQSHKKGHLILKRLRIKSAMTKCESAMTKCEYAMTGIKSAARTCSLGLPRMTKAPLLVERGWGEAVHIQAYGLLALSSFLSFPTFAPSCLSP